MHRYLLLVGGEDEHKSHYNLVGIKCMKLSIVQRIKLGFALLLVLLLVLGAISYSNTLNIHSKLKRVTDDAAPYTLAIGALKESLLSLPIAILLLFWVVGITQSLRLHAMLM